jgi:phosphatidylglycerophosphate synthase
MDYFNPAERQTMQKFAAWRDRKFSRFAAFLADKGVRPNYITLIGLLCLVIGCLAWKNHEWAIFVFLTAYCVIDGLDGVLARKMGLNHEGGAVVDIVADQLGIVFVSAASIYYLNANGVAAVFFSCFYIAFIIIAIYVNLKNIKIPIFFRMKYYFYGFYAISMNASYDIVSYFMMVFAVYYAFNFVFAVHRIYQFYSPSNRQL